MHGPKVDVTLRKFPLRYSTSLQETTGRYYKIQFNNLCIKRMKCNGQTRPRANRWSLVSHMLSVCPSVRFKNNRSTTLTSGSGGLLNSFDFLHFSFSMMNGDRCKASCFKLGMPDINLAGITNGNSCLCGNETAGIFHIHYQLH